MLSTVRKGDLKETHFFASDCAAAFAGKLKVRLRVLGLVDLLAVSDGASPVEDLAVEIHTNCLDGHCESGGVVGECEEYAAKG